MDVDEKDDGASLDGTVPKVWKFLWVVSKPIGSTSIYIYISYVPTFLPKFSIQISQM